MNGKEKTNNLKTWVEVSASALVYNVDQLKSQIKNETKFMAVVKSNAYGHGLVLVAETLKDKVDYFAVDDLDEALELRKSGIVKPILVFGFIPHGRFQEAVDSNIEITVATFEGLNAAKLVDGKIGIHLMVETGLGRQGFLQNQRGEVLGVLEDSNNIDLVGLYSHFSSAENPSALQVSVDQLAQFKLWQMFFENNGFKPITHITATAGIILSKDFECDMVRSGIGLYGLWGSPEIKKKAGFDLLPALVWKSVISEIKTLPDGHSVGYDRTCILEKETKIAVVPVGYWHGYDRGLSSTSFVLIQGKPAKVLGRVSMDMIVVDISEHAEIKVGEEVVLLGGEVSAEKLAQWSETINYEVVTRILPNIPRIAC